MKFKYECSKLYSLHKNVFQQYMYFVSFHYFIVPNDFVTYTMLQVQIEHYIERFLTAAKLSLPVPPVGTVLS